MRVLAVLAAAVVFGASAAQASEASLCGDCLLGVYDDGALTRTTGSISAFQIKSVYLGIRLSPGVRIDQLDFAATYPAGFTVLEVHPYVAGASYDIVGNIAHVEWPQCVTGKRALFRVRVLTTTSVRNGMVTLRNAVARACGSETTPPWLLPAGCYVLNPSGSVPPCATGVAPATWTAVKELFRDLDSR